MEACPFVAERMRATAGHPFYLRGLSLRGLSEPHARPAAVLVDELDTGGSNSSVLAWLELDDQFVAVMQARRAAQTQ